MTLRAMSADSHVDLVTVGYEVKGVSTPPVVGSWTVVAPRGACTGSRGSRPAEMGSTTASGPQARRLRRLDRAIGRRDDRPGPSPRPFHIASGPVFEGDGNGSRGGVGWTSTST
jgi:hypothetical protein